MVGLHSLVSLPYFTRGNTKWFCFVHASPPFTGCLPSQSGLDGAPSVQSHYRTFDPTMSASAPVPRLGTLTLAEALRWGLSLCIGATGSYVPHQSLNQDRAAFMPDASWAVSRLLPTLTRGTEVRVPVSTSPKYVSTPPQRFTDVRLLDPYLTDSSPPFPSTLTTKALDLRSLWWFEVRSCKPTSRGLPSSLMKHRFRPNRQQSRS